MPGIKFPPPDKFIKNELKTLDFLATNLPHYLNDKFGQLARDAHNASQVLRNRNSFNFESFVDCALPKSKYKNLTIHFGGNISVEDKAYEKATYSLSVSQSCDEMYPMLRRFHFDYITHATRVGRKHPQFHMQYSGKLSEGLKSSGFDEAKLVYMMPEFDLPRISSVPMTLALLTNLIAKEFFYWDIEVVKFFSRSEWKKLVKQNEDLVLTPFYQRISDFIGSTDNKEKSELLTTDFFYVGKVV